MSTTWKILAKEILEARRDRSLLLHLVVVPLFLYPILGFGAWQVMLVVQGASEGRQNTAWVDPTLPSALRDSLGTVETLRLHEATPDMLAALDRGDAAALRSIRDGQDSLRVDAVLGHHVDDDGERFVVAYDSSRERSEHAAAALQDHVDEYLEGRRIETAEASGLDEMDLRPLEYETENTADEAQLARFVLSLMLPMLLVLMLPQGAYYTTLDTVVGERERGTLETLLSSPATRTQILTGKFLYVTFSSVLTFGLNLLSLSIFLGFALELMGLETGMGSSLGGMDLLLVLSAALLVAAFLAAAMMVVAVPCKNYREGQSALMPLFLVPALSGLVVATQTDTLPDWLALVPVVNVAAMVREALRGELELRMVGMSLGSLAVLTAFSLWLAARVGRREDILFDANLSLRRLLRREERRSE